MRSSGGIYSSKASPPAGTDERAGQTAAPSSRDTSATWPNILAQLDLQGAARQLASHCLLLGYERGVVRFAIDARNKHMRTPAQEEKLAQALARHYGEPVRLEFDFATTAVETPARSDERASLEDLDTARRAFEDDPGVQGLRERFGATLLPDTVRPLK